MIKVVIAEDQGMMLGAMSTLLNMEEDIEVVGQARNGKEAMELVQKYEPHICLMDIEMPIMTGLDAAEQLKNSSCRVMIVTTFARAGYFERARKADVRGYLLKDSPIEELADAIRAINAGRKIYAPELIDLAYDEVADNPLTNRETEVLRLVAEGKTTKEIAGELYLAPGTVRNYISTIIDKLEVGNRIEAIVRSKEKGWFR